MKKIGLGLLGYGVVGQGLARIIEGKQDQIARSSQAQIIIKRVLETSPARAKDLGLDPDLYTDDIDQIVNDPDIDIVVEVTSALEPAKDMIVKAMENGKDVVTANKAVVSKYYDELAGLAQDKNLYFLYEASVGGGIPVIKPLCDLVVQNEITRVRGILNGTSNYILSKMTQEGHDYDQVLKEAQDLGYAEADPSSDVGGMDTLRKLAILATIAFGQRVREEDILLEGMDKVTSDDISRLAGMGKVIKLIGDAWLEDREIRAVVQPVAVDQGSYFASVTDAYNSVTIHGDVVGELKFYGPGAGMMPTGNAIFNDVLDIVLARQKKIRYGTGGSRSISSRLIHGDFYIRYDQAKVSLEGLQAAKVQKDQGHVLVESARLADLAGLVKADEDAVIIRIEGEDY